MQREKYQKRCTQEGNLRFPSWGTPFRGVHLFCTAKFEQALLGGTKQTCCYRTDTHRPPFASLRQTGCIPKIGVPML